jgi:hypothetical protein
MSAESDQQELSALGFRLDASSGSFRLMRADGSQAALYERSGQRSLSGCLGRLDEMTMDQEGVFRPMTMEQATRIGLAMARAILADEAQRLKLPRWQPPSVDRPPGDTNPVTSYFPEFNPRSVR